MLYFVSVPKMPSCEILLLLLNCLVMLRYPVETGVLCAISRDANLRIGTQAFCILLVAAVFALENEI